MKQKIWTIGFLVMVVAAVFLVLKVKNETDRHITFQTEEVQFLNDNWSYVNELNKTVIVSLPCSLPVDKNYDLTYKRILPDKIDNHSAIAFCADTYNIRVTIGDKEVYHYGNSEHTIFSMPDTSWHVIRVDSEDAGKEISIQYDCYFNVTKANLADIYYGDVAAMGFKLIEGDILAIILSLILAFLVVFLLIMWLITHKSYNVDSVLYLSFFAAMSFVWSISETNTIQFFVENPTLIQMLVFESRMLLPLPLGLFYINYYGNFRKKSLYLIVYTSAILFVAANVMEFLAIANYEQMKILWTSNYIFVCLIIFGFSISQFKNPVQIRKHSYFFAFWLLSVAFAFDFIKKDFEPYSDEAFFSRIGIIIFIITFTYETLRSGLTMIQMGKKAEVFENMAFTDSLASTLNRMAFDEKLLKIDRFEQYQKDVVIIIADLNNLKMINDTAGHKNGDEYIKKAARYLMKHFSGIGSVYRTGGDEFAIIVEDCSNGELMNHIQKLQTDITDHIGNEEIPIFAFGYAKFDPKLDVSLRETMHRADSAMYEQKMRLKEKWKDPAGEIDTQ